MPATPEPTPTELLIDRAFATRAEIARLQGELVKDEAAIIALGKGPHSGVIAGHTVTVVAAVAASAGKVFYALPADPEEHKAAVEKARELAGDEETFRKLFTRVYTYVAVDGFPAVAHALLTPTAAQEPTRRETEMLALCRQTGKGFGGKKAYLLWPKA